MADTYTYDKDAIEARKTQYPIHPLLHSRTSPREMTGEEISDEDLMTLFEAARWAPSHYNLQEWRFVYAKRNTENWQKFMDLLWPLNQKWCENASALVVLLSRKYHDFKGTKTLIPTHSFDAGSAWLSLALEGTARGLVVHAMGGVLYDKAYEAINVNPETHHIDAMIAIGKRPPKELRKMNENITQRKPIESFVSEGVFIDKDDN